ncbi:nicotinamide phosphoribosyl transferase [Alteromonas phage vB_AmeM_PT11-V22]|uniref:Nicotinamide phosphoribosyltransferase n=1 Tax=Alteromonas phage vB_AmeM_PT11-V22 TaxID=2704031 RepID=A0A6C0R0L8_9CAUD|nr:nicotinamide phosphoribosyl transferase [Alteromonas phage vB_AmeM_PT11-V22]QHZ59759.1 nicotinate phosphoribosyltransferase [Alteromonas phage vB_AmeM_PT11-V22]
MTIKFATAHTDFYKKFHKFAYGEGITEVYSNYTSRSGKLSNTNSNEVVFVGLQYFIKDYLIDEWNTTFFSQPKDEVISRIKLICDSGLNMDYDVSHFEDLHDLGYLPIEIKALPEGVSVPYGVPPVTFKNTHPNFSWLSNYIETAFSNENWPIQTSATTAKEYLRAFTDSFTRTGGDLDMIPFMCHNFSARGMFGRQAAAMADFGHLCSFAGTDTISGILFAEEYYNANVEEELVGVSVPATEHSTTTSYIMGMVEKKGITKLEAEVEYVRYLFSKVPTGILSHVSDSFDFWAFVNEGLVELKEDILSRDGTFVIRPDSGDPVDILCGTIDEFGKGTTPEEKGLVECLWDLFGGTETEQGYKLLDSHIGAIYGDSITLERQAEIIKRLEAKGFVPNVVLGVGSYSYQYVTRDTHGSAVKATSVVWDGDQVDVCKDPATDSKKKSAKGLLRVELEEGEYVLYDQQTPEQESQGELKTVFKDGILRVEHSLQEIRERVKQSL